MQGISEWPQKSSSESYNLQSSLWSDSMAQLSQIACESCRTKKCKCDRILPSCSQCSNSQLHCQYPQSGKRGIPTGYISSLENRLLETETALFELLSEKYGLQDDGLQDTEAIFGRFSSFLGEQSKSGRSSEWQQFPLKSREQQSAWWQQRFGMLLAVREDATQNASIPIEPSASRTASMSRSTVSRPARMSDELVCAGTLQSPSFATNNAGGTIQYNEGSEGADWSASVDASVLPGESYIQIGETEQLQLTPSSRRTWQNQHSTSDAASRLPSVQWRKYF